MRVSDLINRLEQLKKENGDLLVVRLSGNPTEYVRKCEDYLTEVKHSHVSLFEKETYYGNNYVVRRCQRCVVIS